MTVIKRTKACKACMYENKVKAVLEDVTMIKKKSWHVWTSMCENKIIEGIKTHMGTYMD